jgi:hypothetical protein
MATESEGLRMARYVNVGVWFYLLVSDAINPVVTNGDFWDEKLRQAFSLKRAHFERTGHCGTGHPYPRLMVRRRSVLALAVEPRLWSPTTGGLKEKCSQNGPRL